ncbi:MAG: alcohol dehydrogenase (cytochrome c) [Gammaproteobacteria bacterium]|jgi:alcohol dehydrogenase (cytochrome c)
MSYQFRSALVLLLSLLVATQAAALDGVYTEEQAAVGKQNYDKYCAECHHLTLRGTGHGSQLTGLGFLAKWGSQSIETLETVSREQMPAGAPNSLKPSIYTAITAHILRVNGAASGPQALRTSDRQAIGAAIKGKAWDLIAAQAAAKNVKPIAFQSWSDAGTIAGQAMQSRGFVNREIKDYAPITDAMLAAPPVGDWLSWRRTQDGHGFSKLDQINRQNVKNLRLAWSITMREGSNQGTPLIHDGVMFLTHPQNVIQAIEAATGELIWEYAYDYPPESQTLGGPTKNIAIYGDKVFVSTYDAALIALDARTGKQLWRKVKADYKEGYTHTAGPVIADGVVVSGINGCERYKKGGCFITGHDPDTGKELWRTSTIALSDDPNNETWGDIPFGLRGGGDTWMPGSYDPALKLFFIGTSQAKPWVAASRGMSALDAALYTNSTLAIEPKTGRIVWHYQHVPGETLDMETGFERVLVDLDDRQLMVTVGKDGILWKLERATGQFVDFTETMYQNLFLPLDRTTGRLRYRQDIIDAKIGDPVSVCPSIYGGHNWQSAAYNPPTHTLIIPLHQLCVDMVGREVEMSEGNGGYGGESRVYEMPGSNGMLGRLAAWDIDTMTERWSHKQRAMFLTAALTTAGGLVFIGDVDRYFKAFNTDDGELLWQTRLGAGLHGYPVTYAVNGRQFIAVQAGMGVMKLLTVAQSSEIYQPNGGNQLYVFELTD